MHVVSERLNICKRCAAHPPPPAEPDTPGEVSSNIQSHPSGMAKERVRVVVNDVRQNRTSQVRRAITLSHTQGFEFEESMRPRYVIFRLTVNWIGRWIVNHDHAYSLSGLL